MIVLFLTCKNSIETNNQKEVDYDIKFQDKCHQKRIQAMEQIKRGNIYLFHSCCTYTPHFREVLYENFGILYSYTDSVDFYKNRLEEWCFVEMMDSVISYKFESKKKLMDSVNGLLKRYTEIPSYLTISEEEKTVPIRPKYTLGDRVLDSLLTKETSQVSDTTFLIIKARIDTNGIISNPKIWIKFNEEWNNYFLNKVENLGLFTPAESFDSLGKFGKVPYRQDFYCRLIPITE